MRTPDLDIDLLRCFATVASAGGFTAAGTALGLTQSAISLKVKRLEDLVRKRVFDRTSRTLSLTRDGEVLLVYARRMLALNDEAVRRMAASPVTGRLRLGVAEHVLPQHLASLLARFAATYPDVQLEVDIGRNEELRAACERGTLDLVIGMRRDGELSGTPIWTETLAWVAAEDWRPPESGQSVRLAMLSADCAVRDRALAALAHAGIPHEMAYTSASPLGVIAAAQAGLGVTVLGRSSVAPGLREVASLPSLGVADMAVFGDAEGRTAMIGPLVDLIREHLSTAALRDAA